MFKAKLNDNDYMYLRDQILTLQTQLNRIERCFYRLLKSCKDSVDLVTYSIEYSKPSDEDEQLTEKLSHPDMRYEPMFSDSKPDSISYSNPDINPDIEIPTWFKDQDDPNVTELLKEIISAIINWTSRKPQTISKETCESLKALYPNKEDRILAVDGDCFITRDIHNKLNYVYSFSYKPDPKSDSWYTREPLTLEERLTKHGNNSTKFYLKFATKHGLLDS